MVQLFVVSLFQLFSISLTSEVISGQNCACEWCVYVCVGLGVYVCVWGVVVGIGTESRPCLTELKDKPCNTHEKKRREERTKEEKNRGFALLSEMEGWRVFHFVSCVSWIYCVWTVYTFYSISSCIQCESYPWPWCCKCCTLVLELQEHHNCSLMSVSVAINLALKTALWLNCEHKIIVVILVTKVQLSTIANEIMTR